MPAVAVRGRFPTGPCSPCTVATDVPHGCTVGAVQAALESRVRDCPAEQQRLSSPTAGARRLSPGEALRPPTEGCALGFHWLRPGDMRIFLRSAVCGMADAAPAPGGVVELRVPCNATVSQLRAAMRGHPALAAAAAGPLRLPNGRPLGWLPPAPEDIQPSAAVAGGVSVAQGPFWLRVPEATPGTAGEWAAPEADPAAGARQLQRDRQTSSCVAERLLALRCTAAQLGAPRALLREGQLFTAEVGSALPRSGCLCRVAAGGSELCALRLPPRTTVVVERSGSAPAPFTRSTLLDACRLSYPASGDVIEAAFTPEQWWDELGEECGGLRLYDEYGITRDATVCMGRGPGPAPLDPCPAAGVRLRVQLAPLPPPPAERSRLAAVGSPFAARGAAADADGPLPQPRRA
eukprot:TRINITY_DN45013_c0_g1_i1.p1 TRINITY_DN45013_c0_g1~~TRINITY_DN45013_c0_g1_i1.p1  ORF type:complete len:439 (+),score=81.15 TRINITY_DN45013_c0_g1_i1:100-1317(+)